MPKALDPRPARTRAAILAAAAEVAARGEPWTVRSITTTAGVSRSVFYLHFTDLHEVGVTMLIDAMRDEGVADLADRELGADPRASAHLHLSAMLTHLRQRQAIFDELLASRPALVYDVIIETCAAHVEILALGHDVDPLAIRYISGGAALAITDWLRRHPEDADSAQAMAARLVSVTPDWLFEVATLTSAGTPTTAATTSTTPAKIPPPGD